MTQKINFVQRRLAPSGRPPIPTTTNHDAIAIAIDAIAIAIDAIAIDAIAIDAIAIDAIAIDAIAIDAIAIDATPDGLRLHWHDDFVCWLQ
jgi:hypothetical protein